MIGGVIGNPLADTLELRGKRAVVTGASSGIGASIARRLASEGVDLVLVARRKERLDALAAELQSASGARAEVVAVDLIDPAGAREVFDRATASGPIEILVNNAGVGLYGAFRDQSWEAQRAMLLLNVVAVTELSHRFVQHMLQLGSPSGVLHVSSVAAFQATPGFAVYGPSKSYIRDFSESLAYELADTNVRVSCLLPGGTKTEFSDAAGQQLKGMADRVMMTADDVALIGIQALQKGRRSVVAGGINKVNALVSRFVPRRMSAWIADFAMRQSVNVAEPKDGPRGSE